MKASSIPNYVSKGNAFLIKQATFYTYSEFFSLFITSNRISDSWLPDPDFRSSKPMLCHGPAFFFLFCMWEEKVQPVRTQGPLPMKQHLSLKVLCCNELADFAGFMSVRLMHPLITMHTVEHAQPWVQVKTGNEQSVSCDIWNPQNIQLMWRDSEVWTLNPG